MNKDAARLARHARAAAALAAGQYMVARRGPVSWSVLNLRTYTENIVTRDGSSWSCTCPDFRTRGGAIGTCKHIEVVKLSMKPKKRARRRKQQVEVTVKNARSADEAIERLMELF